jgi:polyhydroxybutyrate depolymerase
MNSLMTGLGRTAIVPMLMLLMSCTAETSAAFPSVTASGSTNTPEPAARVTAEGSGQITPSPTGIEECVRGDYAAEIESSGHIRRYLLHVPAAYEPEESAALVLAFHGAGIEPERFVDYTRFSNVADREGFLVVYPQGLGEDPVWNPSPGSRDVQFVRDLIDHLQRRCNVEPTRIYATGHSNGGGMAHRLACELADRIAAIGPVSGAYHAGVCSPSRPVPVFAIHGTADPIVSYEGLPEWALAWAQRNGCNPVPVEVVRNVLISEKQWGACRERADVILYTIQDIGHDWPRDLIDVGQTIWYFFEQHPMDRASG